PRPLPHLLRGRRHRRRPGRAEIEGRQAPRRDPAHRPRRRPHRLPRSRQHRQRPDRAGPVARRPLTAPDDIAGREDAMSTVQLLSSLRIGQLTGSTDPGWPNPVDPLGWPLLTDMTSWGVVGPDLGANAEHHDDGRLYIFFGDTATHRREGDPR